MSRIKTGITGFATSLTTLMAVLLLPSLALAEHHEGSTVADEVKATILENNRFVRENLEDPPADTSRHGSLEFWSSGGLIQWVPETKPAAKWKSFALTPKHIQVIELPGGEAAVAMYYSEGSMQPEGSARVGHYMTRVTQVFVKEDGRWKERAGHWSPVAAGGGTSQSAIE